MCLIKLLDFLFGENKPKHNYETTHQYIPPNVKYGRNSGWVKTRYPPKWVKHNLLHAPDYCPQQGVHYFPYCRGRHFEYFYNGYNNKIYRRKLRRRKL